MHTHRTLLVEVLKYVLWTVIVYGLVAAPVAHSEDGPGPLLTLGLVAGAFGLLFAVLRLRVWAMAKSTKRRDEKLTGKVDPLGPPWVWLWCVLIGVVAFAMGWGWGGTFYAVLMGVLIIASHVYRHLREGTLAIQAVPNPSPNIVDKIFRRNLRMMLLLTVFLAGIGGGVLAAASFWLTPGEEDPLAHHGGPGGGAWETPGGPAGGTMQGGGMGGTAGQSAIFLVVVLMVVVVAIVLFFALLWVWQAWRGWGHAGFAEEGRSMHEVIEVVPPRRKKRTVFTMRLHPVRRRYRKTVLLYRRQDVPIRPSDTPVGVAERVQPFEDVGELVQEYEKVRYGRR